MSAPRGSAAFPGLAKARLLYLRMQADGQVRAGQSRIPPGLLARAVSRRSALLRGRVDELTAEVLPALRAGGVRGILLKGPATVAWLYREDGGRDYIDTDILVSPEDLNGAGAVLRRLGFECVFDERDHVGHPHAQMWSRDGSSDVDLHWQLPGIGVAPAEAWRVLSSRTGRLTVGGIEVETLDAPARAFHLAIHAASHRNRPSRAQEDLELAVRRLDDEVWTAAGALAQRLRAEAAVGAGLRSVSSGAALADRLTLDAVQEPDWMLPGGEATPGAHAMRRVIAAPTAGAALRLLARAVFPPPSSMRILHSRRDAGAGELAVAYARRLVRGVWHAPVAVLAVLRAWRLNRRS